MKALNFLKVITLINVTVAAGFSVAGMLNPGLIVPAHAGAGKGMAVFALYAGARTLPFAIIAILSIFNKQWNALITLAVLAGLIQLLDGFIGLCQHDLSKTIGPFIIALLEFAAIYLVLKSSRNAAQH